MRKRHYIQFLLVVALISNTAILKAQTFFEASYGTLLFEVAKFDIAEGVVLSGGKRLNFQYGKFVNNRISRTISLSYINGSTSRDIEQRSEVHSNFATAQNRTVNFELSSIDLEYERKATKFDTEFDDVWNIYSIFSIGASLYTLQEKIIVPPKSTQGISFSKNAALGSDLIFIGGYGWGVGRKIHKAGYIYSDLRATLSLGNDYNRFPILFNLGYRQFL